MALAVAAQAECTEWTVADEVALAVDALAECTEWAVADKRGAVPVSRAMSASRRASRSAA